MYLSDGLGVPWSTISSVPFCGGWVIVRVSVIALGVEARDAAPAVADLHLELLKADALGRISDVTVKSRVAGLP